MTTVAPAPAGVRRPALWAVVGFLVYFAAVVAGSTTQDALGVGWRMGWLQQAFGAAAVLLFAWRLPNGREILALGAPRRGWIAPTLQATGAIVAAGVLADVLLGTPPQRHDLEHFVYQATLPGLGEELGFRGLLLGLLLVALRRAAGRGRRTDWAAVGLAALPFGALHLFEHQGRELAVLFVYTAFAGVLLGALRLRTGSLWPAVLAHNLANVGSGLADGWRAGV